jgi:hypothetical protein
MPDCSQRVAQANTEPAAGRESETHPALSNLVNPKIMPQYLPAFVPGRAFFQGHAAGML